MKLSNSKPKFTEFFGSKGEFRAPKSDIKLHYLLTTGHRRENQPSGNLELLENLKPLRDYVDVKKVDEISDILQRDLSDDRVAKGIVKYLLEAKKGTPIFFPSIVVVLIPKQEFEVGQAGEEYPGVTDDSHHVKTFGQLWAEEPILDGDDFTGISKLKVNFKDTVPLVIDGQHRTAGFRFVSGSMDFDGKNRVFEPFYNAQKAERPPHLEADLPITLVWFERLSTDSEVKVKDFARSMFVDINQSSQQISASRKILLDEQKPSGFLTRCFYNMIAHRSRFSIGQDISLFHSGFDYPYDLRQGKQWSMPTLFVPEILDLLIRAILYNDRVATGSKSANSLLKEGDTFRWFDSFFDEPEGGAFERFHEKISNIDKDSWWETKGDVTGSRSEFEKLFVDLVGLPLYEWLNHNLVFQSSMVVAEKINEGCADQGERPYDSTRFCEIWQDVICSGLGLYYDYDKAQRLKEAKTALRDVDQHFKSEFGKIHFPTNSDAANALHRTSRTVMYVMGYAMVLEWYARTQASCNLKQSVRDLISVYDPKTQQQIVQMIAELSSDAGMTWSGRFKFLADRDPKSWPKFRNIYLRFHPKAFQFMKERELLEWQIFDIQWEDSLKAYWNQNHPEKRLMKDVKNAWRTNGLHADIDINEWNSQRKSLFALIRDLFGSCGLKCHSNFK